jgi:lipoprotein NlpD
VPLGLKREHREPDVIVEKHTVAAGQTLYSIAKTYGVSPDALARANGIVDPKGVAVGTELSLPPRADDSPDPPSERTGSRRASPSSASLGKRPTRDPSHRGDLDWPLRGVLYARFGKKGKEAHDGIDLAAPKGTPIQTARAGTVLYAGEQRGYGLIAIIEHDNGLVTLYAHNNDLRVKPGQKVRSGQVIATVGESGRTSGPHLHFEVRKDGVAVDPLDHLGPIPQ